MILYVNLTILTLINLILTRKLQKFECILVIFKKLYKPKIINLKLIFMSNLNPCQITTFTFLEIHQIHLFPQKSILDSSLFTCDFPTLRPFRSFLSSKQSNSFLYFSVLNHFTYCLTKTGYDNFHYSTVGKLFSIPKAGRDKNLVAAT